MGKLTIVIILLGICWVPAMAEDHSKLEFFVGYQWTHYPSVFAHGWNAAVAGKLNRWLGVEADFSGAYRGSFLHDYTYMVGPVFSLRADRVTPFVHALFGGARFGNSNANCAALGGGLDVHINKRIAVRLFQADWLSFSQSGTTFNKNGRLSTGIVFHF